MGHLQRRLNGLKELTQRPMNLVCVANIVYVAMSAFLGPYGSLRFVSNRFSITPDLKRLYQLCYNLADPFNQSSEDRP